MMCEKEISEFQKKKAESDQDNAAKHKKRYEEAQLTLNETI